VFLLDSETCLQLLEGGDKAVADRLRGQRPSAISLSSMAKAELLSLARGSHRVQDRLEALERFAEPLTVLPFDDRCAEEYGQICAQLGSQGLALEPADLINAATARAYDATLVTRDARRFNDITGLRLVQWK
jgi:tRNA(fMet)-specific endonuclease VapC